MLDKAFDPKTAEPRLYQQWEASGAFAPTDDPAAPAFSIVIPPPNVTGSLHIGHALNNTLQDVLTRFARMRGEAALWLPGTDHAGIATQMVVERQLAAEGNIEPPGHGPRGLRRTHLGMEGAVGRDHRQPAAPAGRLLRLEPRALHPGRGPVRRRAQGVRHPAPPGADLSRQAPGELGSRSSRPPSPTWRSSSGRWTAITGISPIRWRTAPARSSSPPPGRRPCWATPPSPFIPTMSATRPWSASACACPSSAGRSRSSPTTTPTRKGLRAR